MAVTLLYPALVNRKVLEQLQKQSQFSVILLSLIAADLKRVWDGGLYVRLIFLEIAD